MVTVEGYNRTYVELKCHYPVLAVAAAHSYNRTYVELK